MFLTMAEQVITLALYVLAGVPINTHKDLHKPVRVHHLSTHHRVRDRIGPGVSNLIPNAKETPDIRLRTYMYRFQGLAIFNGKPMSGVKVILHVTSSRTVEVREAITLADGSYEISLHLEGSRNEPVDWEMLAYTPDMKKVELVGRRIAMREDDAVTVHKDLNLLDPQA